jgi:propionyl-CoA carboxylase alpha chain
MIRIAEGHEMKLKQDDVKIKGHSIEARVYAEDPARGFLPSPNILTRYVEPKMPGIRIDTSMKEGEVITMHYDPMISKLIATDSNREGAVAKLKTAIDRYVIRGPENNLTFCRDLCDKPHFVDGSYTTAFLPTEYPTGAFTNPEIPQEAKLMLAGVAHALYLNDIQTSGKELGGPKYARIGDQFFALVTDSASKTFVGQMAATGEIVDGSIMLPFNMDQVDMDPLDPIITFSINDGPIYMQLLARTNQGYKVRYQGSEVNVDILSAYGVECAQHEMPPHAVKVSPEVASPMTGRVKDVLVKVGDKVNLG